MCGQYINEPLYLSIANWVMKQGRWTTAREISNNFDIRILMQSILFLIFYLMLLKFSVK